jgi:Binding-protein-dependent transport system inner membrane component
VGRRLQATRSHPRRRAVSYFNPRSPEYLRSVGLGETLLRVTPRGEVDVDLARGFEWTKPQTLRVDLRPEATFWSGAPVTAGAVQAGMERLRRLVPFAASLLRGLSGEAHVVGWISTQGARQVDRSRDVRVELPQVIGPVVVLAALDLGALLLAISSLSFLGLGAQPPTPEWGAMLAEGRRSFLEYQHLMVFPGGAIFLAALAFSLLGEGTRDLLDPRGAGRRL